MPRIHYSIISQKILDSPIIRSRTFLFKKIEANYVELKFLQNQCIEVQCPRRDSVWSRWSRVSVDVHKRDSQVRQRCIRKTGSRTHRMCIILFLRLVKYMKLTLSMIYTLFVQIYRLWSVAVSLRIGKFKKLVKLAKYNSLP